MLVGAQRERLARSGSHSQWKIRSAARRQAALLLFTLLLVGPGRNLCKAEDKPAQKPLFLVARPTILDPVFAKSVVLMLPLEGEPIIVGLIVNKPTTVQLGKLFPDRPILKGNTDAAYLGGPVDPDTGALAFHAAKAPKRAMLLYDDVYLTFDSKLISRLLRDPKQTGDVRLFLGRAQWAPEQLQSEALEDSWYSLRAEGSIIFERDSESLWRRMHARAEPPSHAENRLPRSPNVRVRTPISVAPVLRACMFSGAATVAPPVTGKLN